MFIINNENNNIRTYRDIEIKSYQTQWIFVTKDKPTFVRQGIKANRSVFYSTDNLYRLNTRYFKPTL